MLFVNTSSDSTIWLLQNYLNSDVFILQVDKQEKKKARTGRSKRRQQYNQRFVNYVQQFGRRRGPNSNA